MNPMSLEETSTPCTNHFLVAPEAVWCGAVVSEAWRILLDKEVSRCFYPSIPLTSLTQLPKKQLLPTVI